MTTLPHVTLKVESNHDPDSLPELAEKMRKTTDEGGQAFVVLVRFTAGLSEHEDGVEAILDDVAHQVESEAQAAMARDERRRP